MGRTARRSKWLLTSLVVLVFAAAAVAGAYMCARLVDVGAPPAPRPSRPSASVIETTETETRNVKIYVMKVSQNNASLTPIAYEVPSGEDPKKAAIKRLLSIPKWGGASAGLIPPDVRMINLTVQGGLARLDLSREFVDGFTGGSMQESLTVRAILRTLGQFRDVKRVQILIEGRRVESLGGHFDLSTPQPCEEAGATE